MTPLPWLKFDPGTATSRSTTPFSALRNMGFHKLSRRQVVRWASELTLPFFRQGKCL